VISEKKGRESFYRVSEPLMPLTMKMKQERGQPIRLVIDFLRFWYTAEELEQQLQNASGDGIDISILEAALKESKVEEDPKVKACLRDLEYFTQQKNTKEVLRLLDELRALWLELYVGNRDLENKSKDLSEVLKNSLRGEPSKVIWKKNTLNKWMPIFFTEVENIKRVYL
jgi:hypothetical protein